MISRNLRVLHTVHCTEKSVQGKVMTFSIQSIYLGMGRFHFLNNDRFVLKPIAFLKILFIKSGRFQKLSFLKNDRFLERPIVNNS